MHFPSNEISQVGTGAGDQTDRNLKVQAQISGGSPIPTFVINTDHVVTHWNLACQTVTGLASAEAVGTRNQWRAFYPEERPVMADLIITGALEELVDLHYHGKFKRSSLIDGAFEAEDFFPHMGTAGRWLQFTAAPLRDDMGAIIGAIETLQDVSERKLAEMALQSAQEELEKQVAERTGELALANMQLAADLGRRKRNEEELTQYNIELVELNQRLVTA